MHQSLREIRFRSAYGIRARGNLQCTRSMVRSLPLANSPPSGVSNWYTGAWEDGELKWYIGMPPASYSIGLIRIQCIYDSQMKSNAWLISQTGLISANQVILYSFNTFSSLFLESPQSPVSPEQTKFAILLTGQSTTKQGSKCGMKKTWQPSHRELSWRLPLPTISFFLTAIRVHSSRRQDGGEANR